MDVIKILFAVMFGMFFCACTSDYDGTWYLKWQFKNSQDSTILKVKFNYSLSIINKDGVGTIGYDHFTDEGIFFAGIMYQGTVNEVKEFPDKSSIYSKFWLDTLVFLDSLFTWDELDFTKGTVNLNGFEYENQDVSYKTFYISIQ